MKDMLTINIQKCDCGDLQVIVGTNARTREEEMELVSVVNEWLLMETERLLNEKEIAE